MSAEKHAYALAISIAGLMASSWAIGTTEKWVKDEATSDGGTIYLNQHFDRKSGTFAATPESVLDNRDSISGTFLVGTYRIVTDQGGSKMTGVQGEQYDELISTELIDCKNGYAGTLRRIEKLNGQVVHDETMQDKDVMMTQTHQITTDSKLCQLSQGQARSSLHGADGANPQYRPGTLSASDIDKLIDQHTQPDPSTSGGKPT